MSDTYRQTIYVSNRVLWMLRAFVRRNNQKMSDLEVPLRVNELVSEIVTEYIERKQPDLIALWSKRERLDKEAAGEELDQPPF